MLLATGQGGHIPWPPRLPDLIHCGFYLWGYVKYHVYHRPMPQSLRERISQAIANLDESQLPRKWKEFECPVGWPAESNPHLQIRFV
jgi:hypothetical protein